MALHPEQRIVLGPPKYQRFGRMRAGNSAYLDKNGPAGRQGMYRNHQKNAVKLLYKHHATIAQTYVQNKYVSFPK